MLEEILKTALTKDQQDAGLTLSDGEHFLLLRQDGRIVKILSIYSTIQDIRREADPYFNHKELQCSHAPILRQEGWCSECNIYTEEVSNET